MRVIRAWSGIEHDQRLGCQIGQIDRLRTSQRIGLRKHRHYFCFINNTLQVADSLRGNGYTEQITIVADEAGLPYQRPQLSKDFLSPQGTPKPLPLRGENFFSQKNINLLDGVSAIDIDRPNRQVALSNGNSLGYTHLVLATGVRNRLIECPGSKLDGVHSLRTLDDVQDLHAALPAAKNVVVVGAGFIGLEFAAGARAHDCHVTVLEFAARPMARALSEPMSQWFAQAHRDLGVELRLNEGIESFEAAGGGVSLCFSSRLWRDFLQSFLGHCFWAEVGGWRCVSAS
ncbi:NAD(P)/FAD-dependent oxidoreductase [Glutamicibacter protophormiae]|nr:NAD(P)/FAD-dependent oxidoreductase [Glutamicibacter protophormiae]